VGAAEKGPEREAADPLERGSSYERFPETPTCIGLSSVRSFLRLAIVLQVKTSIALGEDLVTRLDKMASVQSSSIELMLLAMLYKSSKKELGG
jgi:hypothetical protein